MKHLATLALLTITLCVGCQRSVQDIDNQMHYALIRGDLELTQKTLDQSKSPAELATKFLSLAMIHTQHNHGEMVKLLVENGGDLNSTQYGNPVIDGMLFDDMTPELLQWCIDHGYDVNAAGSLDRTALVVCLESLRHSPQQYEMIRILIDNGANVNVSVHGMPVLHELIVFNESTPPVKELLELFIASGADIDAKNERGKTPLITCFEHGRKDIAEILIEHSANPNAADEYGNTVLFQAANCGDSDFVELLIAAGADVNKVNAHNGTPLRCALHHSDSTEMVEMLLAAGANPNHIKNGKTILDTIDRPNSCQPEAERQQLIQLLTQYGAKTADELKDTNA